MPTKKELIAKINQLKKEKNAVCLVHNYQTPDIYEIADYIGDSLDLSQAAAKTDADIIVFCGVDFMAESAKILSPKKKVLHPNTRAKCPMARMVTPVALRKKKKQHPDAEVACYINTTTDTKAESDICTTSANAADVVNSVKKDRIIFVPDRNLGQYAQSQTSKKIILWDGYCYVHDRITLESAKKAKARYPDAELMAHPECRPELLNMADAVCSTSQMLTYAKKSHAKEFIVATEEGMVKRLEREFPGKKFHPIGGICTQMKEITLHNICESLEKEQFEIKLDENLRKKAKTALDRMLELRKNK